MSDTKALLRREILAELARIPQEKRVEVSSQACALLRQQTCWRRARSVLFYAPIQNELDVWPLIDTALAEGKLAALPRYIRKANVYTACRICDPPRDVAAGHLRIREPREHCSEVPLKHLDFVLVPGVAFDMHGCRLGRGKGFYDRLLQAIVGTTCGVAFEEQIVREVPVEPHDVHLDCILTPRRWIEL